VELLLFEHEDDLRPARVIRIDPVTNRTYHYWHTFVLGVGPGQIYGYRVEGPSDPDSGMRFDPGKILLDPYGRGVVVPRCYDRDAAAAPGNNSATAMKSVVLDSSAYDWEGDIPLHRPSSQTVVYEMHVRGFTRHPSSGLSEMTRGTFAGLTEKIPYLSALGLRPLNCCRCFSSMPRTVRPGWSIIGVMRLCLCLRRIAPIARVRMCWVRLTNSGTW
jgi:glycogen operon protein